MVRAAIFCEGKNDRKFLEALIKHLGFDAQDISFYVLKSKSNFFKHNNQNYQDVRMEIDSGAIDKLLFIVDADCLENDGQYGGFEKTQSALHAIIKKLGFEAISNIYIMCDPNSRSGYLESFILSTISEQQRCCIKSFLECSQFKDKENHKAILNQIYSIAYPDAPYDFEHPHFEDLKTKLQSCCVRQ